ncbi:MAG: hypothetical protein ACLUFN_04035 [Eubacterium sp.]
MKKLICILFSIIIIFSFSGCSNNVPIKKYVNDFVEKINNPLKTVDLSELGNISLIDFANHNNIIAILYSPFISETELTDEEYNFKTYLTLYDIKKERLKKTVEVDTDSFEVAFSDDYIQVRNGEDASELYDLGLNKIGNGESKFLDGYDIANTIDTIDADHFVCRESYAYDSSYINHDVIIFYNDTKNYYINEYNKPTNDISGYEKVIFDYTLNNDNEITLNIKNYENLKLVNSITLDNENDFSDISSGIINSEYAIFETLKNDGSTNKLYCWRYNDNAVDTPLDCTIVNDNDFENHVNTVCRRIEKNYGVYIELSKSLPKKDFVYKCIDNKTNAQYLLCLYDLEYCLSTFPKQIYKEMLCNDIEETISEFKRLKIYIVGEIDENEISAFAHNLNDELIIVYSCGLFSYLTFCHELMHNLEYRIWNYEPDFDEKWEALNPDDFSYTAEYLDTDFENDSYLDYFARDYGMSGLLEDRATVFEMYYDAKHSNGDPWWTEHKQLNEKVNYLNAVLAKSYPSLSVKS